MPRIGLASGPRRSVGVAGHQREPPWSQQGFGSGEDGGTASPVLFGSTLVNNGQKVALFLRRLLEGGQMLVNTNIINGMRLKVGQERLDTFHSSGSEAGGGRHSHDSEKSWTEEEKLTKKELKSKEKKKMERKSIELDVNRNQELTNDEKSRESVSREIAQAQGAVATK